MRDPAILAWPDAFAPRSMSVTIDRPVFKGPKPLDGREQVVAASAGGWLISYEGVPVYGQNYRSFRPMWVALAAFGRPVYVKPDFTENMLARRNLIDPIASGFSPYAVAGNELLWAVNALNWGTGNPLLWGNELAEYTSFEDGSFFTQSTGDCLLAAAAKRGDTSITVGNSIVSPIEVGDYFEIDGRLHIVNGIDGQTWSIWPSLRANYAIGTVLEIDDPRLLTYMTTDSRGSVMSIDARAITFMTLEFVEAGW